MSKFEIIITSVPDRENLVAEIWHEQKMLAEVSNENGIVCVELYAVGHIKVSMEEFLSIFNEAEKKLSNS